MLRQGLHLLYTWAAILLCACSPQYPPPDGYVDACYGGDFSEKLDGATPKFTMKIHATQEQWPQLAERFKSFGATHDLVFFDTSVNVSGLRMLEVHLCSAKGLWLFADKRLWEKGPKDPNPEEMSIYLYQHNKSFDWESVAVEFEKALGDWPGTVKSQWPGR